MSEARSDNLSFNESFGKTDLFGKTVLILSSWFGAGLMPRAPGTFATLATIPLVIILNYLGIYYMAVFLVFLVPVAVWSSGISQRLLGRDDPPEVVIDEAAGFLLTFFLLPLSWFSLSLGFILFRFFDILKPFPIKRSEKIEGGTGIVLDDLLAGVYANLGLRVVIYFL